MKVLDLQTETQVVSADLHFEYGGVEYQAQAVISDGYKVEEIYSINKTEMDGDGVYLEHLGNFTESEITHLEQMIKYNL